MSASVIHKKTGTIWYLSTNELLAGENHLVRWDSFLPQGGTKHQRAYLLKSSKQLLGAMIDAPRTVAGCVVASGTVLNWVHLLKRLVRWMNRIDLWRFSQLTSAHLTEYLRNIKGRGDLRSSRSSLNAHVRLLSQMWILRGAYIASIRVNVDALEIDCLIDTRPRGSWKAIDEATALALIKESLQWIRGHGEYLCSLGARLWEMNRGLVGQKRARKNCMRTSLLVAEETSAQFLALRSRLRMDHCDSTSVVASGFRALEGACIVAVLFLVGVRNRELTRLDAGCLTERLQADGSVSLLLEGIAAKDDGRPRTWAVTKEVGEVVRCLEDLHAVGRMRKGTKALILQQRNGHFPADPARKVGRITPAVLAKRLALFAELTLDPQALGKVRIHAHAARKTFARFVVMRDKRSLESLAHHFGHTHKAVTDGYYVGSDIELAKLLSIEGRRDLADGLTKLLTSPFLGGKAGESIMRMRTDRGVSSFRGRKALSTLVEKLISDGVQLAPCDWGYCVYSQSLAACQGDANGPNERNRSPEICGGCSNFAVTDQHRLWWESRYKREADFLARGNISAQTRQLVSTRLEGTARVLRNLARSHRAMTDDTEVKESNEAER